MFDGTVMSRVGESPLHRVVIPSFLAIFRSPSKVELNVFFCVSSTAHSAPPIVPDLGAAMHSSPPLLVAKKTSLQHAVIPRFGGNELKGGREDVASSRMALRGDGDGCD